MVPPRLNRSVNSEVGADKRLASTPQGQSDERIQRLVRHVEEHGYVVIQDAFSDADIAEAKAEVMRLSTQSVSQQTQPRQDDKTSNGRNTFEGLKTTRVYSLANKSRVFDKFALHPDILALNSHFLESGYLLNSFQSITIRPGEQAQTLHYDDGYITIPRPHSAFGTAIMVAIDPYTLTNGATVIVPKSHKWGPDRHPQPTETVSATMPAGSALFFLSTLWHGGGANISDGDRVALTVQYCQPWIRQLENQMLAVEWERLGDMPPRLVDMLGYKVGAPFIGHVDGRSPRAAVERMMRARQRSDATDPKL